MSTQTSERTSSKSALLGTCIWCRKPVRGSSGVYSAGVVYHRGECGDAYRERHEAFFAGLKREREAVVHSVAEQAPEVVGKPTRPVLRYHGGKFRLAPWIISHFPAHRVYVEPFAGAASVLMQKPRSYGEVINDLDCEIVRLFRVLRDPKQSADLARLLRLTPYAREEFLGTYEPTEDDLEAARRMVARSFMGFGSAATCEFHLTGFRSNATRSGTTPAQDWARYPEQVARFCARMEGVVIEDRPALRVIRQHDTAETLFYVDPPYLHSTRTHKRRATGQVYRHEMTDDDHRELATVLRAARGYVVLSGYPCSLYDQELYPDWHRVTTETHADGAVDRTEVLWLSPRTWEALQRERNPALAPLGGLFAGGDA